MSSNNFFKSDLFGIYNIVQASMILYPKEIIISTLRNFFSQDSYYHYSKDQWGFANTTDHTDLPPGADLPYGPGANPQLNPSSVLPTRLLIAENYRFAEIFYPAILVKSGGSKYVPISINREQGTVIYSEKLFFDGYGHSTTIHTPTFFMTAGAWEGQIIIDVLTRSLRSRDDLVELISMCFTELNFESLYDIGIIVKPISISGTSETDDRNDKLFKQTLTLDIRTEWQRNIPINDLIDTIFFTLEFGNINNSTPIAQNLTVNTEISLLDNILNLTTNNI